MKYPLGRKALNYSRGSHDCRFKRSKRVGEIIRSFIRRQALFF